MNGLNPYCETDPLPAFGMTVGAIAVAVALAFGLGGRDVAARQVEEWREQISSRTQNRN